MIATHLGAGALLSQVCRRAAVTQLIHRNDDLEAEKYGLIEENNALAAENAKLRLEAQAHAQEARTQRSTVHSIYQIVSEGAGEPGDWNGAEPVRKAFEALQADNRELRRQLASMRAA
ncbi:hypothetical protein HaloA020_28760 [Halomonas sp. A020]|uniref:hypothetical protein n=1 Tax=Halomonas sp. A020 TaxID=2717374 RepID=UPI0024938277|nr:hypothetical protein [Halomonas sp. A020]BCB62175.1 hypothetical protein HaloA020_28760 [Halomonas sp. A020]